MKITDFAVGTIFYNQPEMLKKHLEHWESYPNSVQKIIVDDCSKQKKLPAGIPNDICVYRITDDIQWNQTGARNLLYFCSEKLITFSSDIDHVLPCQSLLKLASLDFDSELSVHFLDRQFISLKNISVRRKMHSSFALHTNTYMALSGHCEELAGNYGGVDASWTALCKKYLNYYWNYEIKVLNFSFSDIEDRNVSVLSRNPRYNLKMIKSRGFLDLHLDSPPIRFGYERLQ